MENLFYEKRADESKHFYFANFPDMLKEKYKFVGPHIHRSIEIVVCYSGEMKAKVNKQEYLLRAGDILLINSLDWHFYEYHKNAGCFILVIGKEFINDVLDNPDIEFNNVVSLEKEEFTNFYNETLKAFNKFDKMTFLSRKSFVLNFFSMLENHNLYRKKEKDSGKESCRQIICYIEDHYIEKLTSEAVANVFGYSKNYFSFLFNKNVGENFNTFLNKFRIIKVKEMLSTNKSMLIEEAIFKCGFTSRETYYRCLRNIKGIL